MHASLGGPMVRLGGLAVPVPMVQAGFRYGLTDSVAIGVDLPITVMLLRNAAIDPHVTWFPTRSLGLQAEGVLVFNPAEKVFRAYPVLSSWYVLRLSPAISLLPGVVAMGQGRSPHVLASPSLAGAFAVGRWELLVETMYLLPYMRNTYSAVTYVSPGRGAVGLYVGLGRRFK